MATNPMFCSVLIEITAFSIVSLTFQCFKVRRWTQIEQIKDSKMKGFLNFALYLGFSYDRVHLVKKGPLVKDRAVFSLQW